MGVSKTWCVLALSAACLGAQAQVFKWVDASGATHYAAQAPTGQRVTALDLKLTRVSLPESKPAQQTQPAHPPAVPEKKDCGNINGTWQVSHISTKLDKDEFEEAGPTWTFRPDGRNTFACGDRSQEFAYQCEDGELYVQSPVRGKYRIVRSNVNQMVWRNEDYGGYVYLKR